MKITIYETTLEQAILDDPNLTAEDKEIVEDNMSDYIQALVKDFEASGDEVEVACEAISPGPVYHAVLDDGQLTDIEIVDFWDWFN